ncbi:MAG: hypothetical protein GX936_09390 [Clostridiales bacterium]|nr:hypothetical protein [Clostridiales bacterium]
MKKKNRAAKILISILAVIQAILATFYIILKTSLKPPPVNPVPKPTVSSADTSANAGTAVTGSAGIPTETPVRDKTKFTFVILGMDNGFGNTDTIMVATFDSTNYTLNVVSIPRDTLVNVSWPTKKANTLYSNGGIEKVIDGMTALLGFRPDHYIRIELDAFSKLVDAVGGVYFNVPKDMNYDDDAQNLHIHLTAGPQRLNGDKALQLVRAREKVWATGDIGRIETQQAFLKAAAKQILEKKNTIKITALIDIFLNDIDTDLTEGNLGWFAKEFLKMDAEKVSFETIPAKYNDSVKGVSYCTIKLDEWLDIVNTKLNPFEYEITAEDVSILTRNAKGELYVTDGNWASRKFSSGSSGSAGVSGKPEMPSEPSPGNIPPSPSNGDSSPSTSSEPPASGGEDSSHDTNPDEPGGEALPGEPPNPSQAPETDEAPPASPNP